MPRLGNRHRILHFETPLRGVFLANTTQIYPEDRGTNYSVRLGRAAAGRIAAWLAAGGEGGWHRAAPTEGRRDRRMRR